MLDEYTSALALSGLLQSPVYLSQTYAGSATDASYLRSYFVNEITSYYGVDAAVFDVGSITATTLVRDFVHKLVYFHDELQNYSALVSSSQALPLELDVAPLLRHTAWALCGEISWQTFQIYRALGYECRLVNTLNGSADSFTDGHVFIEVRDPVTGRYFIQDPTYNVAHVALDGTLLDLQGLRELALDHPGEHLSQSLGGTVYTYFHATGVVMATLDAPFDNFIKAEALVTPWHITSSSGTYALWADFRDDRKAPVADDLEFKTLIVQAKQDGLDFDATVQRLAAHYDLYGIEFVDATAPHGLVLVARAVGGGDLSIDFDTLTVVVGGVHAHWAALAHGESAGLPGIDYSDAYRMIGANGIEADYGIDVGILQQPAASPLDFSYPNGYGAFQVVMDSGSIVKSTASDLMDREPWVSWSEYRRVDDGSLLKIVAINDDTTVYRAQYDLDASQPWAMREEVFSSTGALQVLRVENDDATVYRAQYDLDASQPWALKETLSDAEGHTFSESLTAHDGTRTLHLHDLLDINSWESIDRYFSTNGQLSMETEVQDNGFRTERKWDIDNTETWLLMESQFDAAGHLIAQIYTPDYII